MLVSHISLDSVSNGMDLGILCLTHYPFPGVLDKSDSAKYTFNMSKSEVHREAYRYILGRLSKLPADVARDESIPDISLEELNLLKEGRADPSASLVASLKQLLTGTVTESEIEAHL